MDQAPQKRPERVFRRIFAVWLLLAGIASFAALPQIDALGLYYDEAFLAQQARDFVEPGDPGQHPASVRSVSLLGRPFPLRNAVYLGSLKSQLLIPALALAGSSPQTVRVATFATALLALLLAMLWAARVFGQNAAALMGVLVASDPSFYFLSQFEWGPFTTNFLCRAGGALLVTLAWRSDSVARASAAAVGAGALLGLGVFSRADFILIPLTAGVALGICRPDLIREALRSRRGPLAAGAVAFFLSALPMIRSAWALLGATGATADRGGWLFRAQVFWQSLDGSQFFRLMETGGLFERTPDVESPGGLLGWLILPAAAVLLLDIIRRRPPDASALRDPRAFLLVFAALLTSAMLALPGAVRAHHQLNVLPLLHLIIACAALALGRSRTSGSGAVFRGVAVLGLTGLVAGNFFLIHHTSEFIRDTGGRGRWSHALNEFAAEVDGQPGGTVVSMDWGFHEPLLFLTRQTRLVESIWALPQAMAAGRPWVFEAEADTIYLVHDTPYDLFGLGPKFLLAARLAENPAADITPHYDKSGDLAFYSVRVVGPHRLRYDGKFRIR
ncbi:MAG TPA: hypothetical protein EYQ54_04955 [Myxococcales bacterium]|nr:hypothetical protein [Myxococcales bacterium]